MSESNSPFKIDKNALASKGVWGAIGSLVLGGILAIDPGTRDAGMGVISAGLLSLWGRITAQGGIKLW